MDFNCFKFDNGFELQFCFQSSHVEMLTGKERGDFFSSKQEMAKAELNYA